MAEKWPDWVYYCMYNETSGWVLSVHLLLLLEAHLSNARFNQMNYENGLVWF